MTSSSRQPLGRHRAFFSGPLGGADPLVDADTVLDPLSAHLEESR